MASDLTYHPPIKPQPGFADIVRSDETYARPDGQGMGQQLNGWFDKLMLQSGLEISPGTLLMLCFLCSLTLGGALFVLQENLLSTAFAAIIGGILPVVATIIQRVRRQREILRQMPAMVGELARAARTGRSLEQCLQLVANDTPAPLGTELQRCAQRMQLGMSIPVALGELPERTGVVSINVLVTALVVHHQTGGNLVTVLERLQQTIRDRLTFLGRLRTATSASRATAIMMLVLPPGILAFFIFRDPEYFNTLMESTWGRWSTIVAVGLQIIGSIWVIRILQNSQRT
ncbi:MAG: type II secretion system F family protein [Planctomycetaceae bacterium]|nr:type II secretion system F family protein [Planctomycetaceae bacterium]